jgi:hypothetical protein
MNEWMEMKQLGEAVNTPILPVLLDTALRSGYSFWKENPES